MKSLFLKYPSYQSSGVEWLGDVPSHWEMKKLKYMVEIDTGYAFSSEDYEDDGLPLIRIGDINADGSINIDDAKCLPEDYSSIFTNAIVTSGDILMAMTGATIGKAGLYTAPVPALLNQRVARFRSHRISTRFLWYLLNSTQYHEHIVLTGFGGAQPNISDTQLLDFTAVVPPQNEQEAIARFLDKETARLDGVIKKREKLIGLLREKRAALISHAVTKGLNPDASMKPSGIDWLGDVPAHWNVKKLKYNISLNDEVLSETTDQDYEFEYIDIGSVNWEIGITKKEVLVFENAPSRARRVVRIGDTIVSTVRTYLRAIAAIAESDDGNIVSTGFAVLRPKNLYCGYLSYFTRANCFVENVVARSFGVSYPAINASEIASIFSPVPPLPEQQAIADYLDRETKRLDDLVEKEKQIIERMKEYRSAIISAAVTGKIDVRECV